MHSALSMCGTDRVAHEAEIADAKLTPVREQDRQFRNRDRKYRKEKAAAYEAFPGEGELGTVGDVLEESLAIIEEGTIPGLRVT